MQIDYAMLLLSVHPSERCLVSKVSKLTRPEIHQ